MPTYDYQCEGSNVVYEVSHPMALSINTWKELCEHSDLERMEHSEETPVTKVISGSSGSFVSSSALKNPELPPCSSGGGCPGGGCGI